MAYMFTELFYPTILTAFFMFALWLYQLRTRDAGIVDFGWALSIALLSLFFAIYSTGTSLSRLLAGVLGVGWAGRLAAHIYTDRIRAHQEDGRYQAMRSYFGSTANLFFFFFFLFQGGLAILFAIPFQVIASDPRPISLVRLFAGLTLWIVAIVGESVADRQLAKFRNDPNNKGRTCREGLWRYSRHPNYFFEWLHWWAYPVLVFGADGWWITLLHPLLMLLFLFRLTGIPYTEAQALKSRGDDYREYQRTTSVFIPLPPRNVPSEAVR